jgi:catechol 2,3-dioxygenase-like lactoylglutathione lyase family enzyme
MSSFKFVCPLITVSNIQLSRNFYENILNQKVKFDFGANITFQGDFAIHLDSHFRDLIDNKEIVKGSNSFELYFEYDDLEKFVEVLVENQVELVHPLREQPWKQKVVRFYDPDRHIIEVGESMENVAYRLSKEGLSETEIARSIMMPVEFVKNSIQSFSSEVD